MTGYVFNKTFHFVALKQNTEDVEHILTASLVVGFIYCKIASLIPIHISDKIDTILGKFFCTGFEDPGNDCLIG